MVITYCIFNNCNKTNLIVIVLRIACLWLNQNLIVPKYLINKINRCNGDGKNRRVPNYW